MPCEKLCAKSITREKGAAETPGGLKDWLLGGACLAAGAGLGAGLMYFWDPNRGRARRTLVAEKTASIVRRGERLVVHRTADVLNHAKGAAAAARAAFSCSNAASDDILLERVKSHLGHFTARGHGVEVQVTDGVVALRGALPDAEMERLVRKLGRFPE